MNKIVTVVLAATLGLSLLGMSGCSDESKEKWKAAGSAAVDATKETAKDVKAGAKTLAEKAKEGAHKAAEKAKEVIQHAKATDPDTGEVINNN